MTSDGRFAPDMRPIGAKAEESDDESDASVEIDSDEVEFRITLLDLPVLARFGRYELLGRLAYGGMAEIFLAREAAHQGAHRMLVLKRVLPHVAADKHFVGMFTDEARLAMQLNHPNICHVYGLGEEEGSPYIAMEWVNGRPLSKIIKRARERGGIPVPLALRIMAQVAEALDYAHRACDAGGEPLGIVHRDVSPQNIMVSYDGVVKLLDFGIAKASSHSTRTEAGVIKGKFAYMSPQQCVGEPVDARADVFAIGTCLFESLAGKNPFRRKNEFETMMRIVGEHPPSLRALRAEVSEDVEAIALRALMKQPEARYQTAADMQQAMEQVLAKLGVFVNSSKVADYMASLFADEIRSGPELDVRLSLPPPPKKLDTDEASRITRASEPGATLLDAEPLPAMPAHRPKRGSALPWVLGALVLLLMLGIGSVAALLLLAPWQSQPATVTAAAPRTVTVGAEPVGEPIVPSAPVVESGSVLLESDPSGAQVRVGDRGGRTPLTMGAIHAGTYPVHFELQGYAPWDGEVVVGAGQHASVSAQLTRLRQENAPAAGGQLSLNTSPWSRVYLGSRLLGTTPLGHVNVPAGTQRLRLVDRDGTEHRVTVHIASGRHTQEFFDLR